MQESPEICPDDPLEKSLPRGEKGGTGEERNKYAGSYSRSKVKPLAEIVNASPQPSGVGPSEAPRGKKGIKKSPVGVTALTAEGEEVYRMRSGVREKR